MVVTKDEALEMFQDNPFKVKILSTKVPDGTRTTVYRCGDLIDLCRGPHLAHTGKVKAFAAAKHSAAYWLGDAENDSLQRLYGISFPDKKQLKVWQEMMEKVRCGTKSLLQKETRIRCYKMDKPIQPIQRKINDEKTFESHSRKHMTDNANTIHR